ALVDGRRGARPVAVVELRVSDVVTVLPDHVAGFGVEAKDAFLFLRLLVIIEEVNATVGDGDAGVAAADRLAPARLELGGKLFRQVKARQDAVAVWPAPLRPVRGRGGPDGQNEDQRETHGAPSNGAIFLAISRSKERIHKEGRAVSQP